MLLFVSAACRSDENQIRTRESRPESREDRAHHQGLRNIGLAVQNCPEFEQDVDEDAILLGRSTDLRDEPWRRKLG